MRFLPKWRVLTWVIVGINLLFLLWVFGGAGAAADNCNGLRGANLDACEAGTAIGAGIAITGIFVLWVMVDIILGAVWLVTNRSKSRDCPVCGSDVKKGATVCKRCGHDFAVAARRPIAPAAPPA